MSYFGQVTPSNFKLYNHSKDIQIIIKNTKSSKELRQCVHNDLLSWVIIPISVGSVPVSSLFDRYRYSLKLESHKTCKQWEINQLTHSIFKLYMHSKDLKIIIQNEKSIRELRQCVHNNLPSSFIIPISVGSVPVSSLYDSVMNPLKWESQKTCK